jgi:hypothetical protein
MFAVVPAALLKTSRRRVAVGTITKSRISRWKMAEVGLRRACVGILAWRRGGRTVHGAAESDSCEAFDGEA